LKDFGIQEDLNGWISKITKRKESNGNTDFYREFVPDLARVLTACTATITNALANT
jgi:hypothetical protein